MVDKELILSARRWGIKLGYSLFDQALVSGSTLVLNLFLARIWAPDDYGAFAIVFSFFLLLSGFHNAIILEPMSVFGPGKYAVNIKNYLEENFWLHLVTTVLFSVLLAGLTQILPARFQQLQGPLLSLSLIMPIYLLTWFFRRAYYITSEPRSSVLASLLFVVGLIIVIFVLDRFIRLTPSWAIMGIGIACTGSCAYSIFSFRFFSGSRQNLCLRLSRIRSTLKENWQYGKWVVLSALVFWFVSIAYLPLIGIYSTIDAAGFKSIQNLVVPLTNSSSAVTILILPWMSGVSIRRGISYLCRVTIRIGIVLLILSMAYIGLLNQFGLKVISLIYGAGTYSGYYWLIPFIGLVGLFGTVELSFSSALRSIGKPNLIFFAQLIGAASTLSLGVYLVRNFGIQGAALGQLFSSGIQFIIIITLWGWMFFRSKVDVTDSPINR